MKVISNNKVLELILIVFLALIPNLQTVFFYQLWFLRYIMYHLPLFIYVIWTIAELNKAIGLEEIDLNE